MKTGRAAFEQRFIELANRYDVKHLDWERISYGDNAFAFRLSDHIEDVHSQYQYTGAYLSTLRNPCAAADVEFDKLVRLIEEEAV